MILKNLNYKIYIKIMFLFIIFIFFFYTNVFATRLDDKDIDGTSNDNILVKSDFEGGYVKFIYKIKTLKGYVDKDIKYYKFVYAKDAAGKKTPLWLYNHSVSTYDVEIKNAQTSGKVPEFYINGAKVDDTLFYGQYYMWPISNVKYDGKIVGLPKQKIIDDYISVSKANGDKANTDLGKLVIKHNINDWTQISKPENYILMYMIPENTGNTGVSYKNEYVIIV